jgi:signal transduction histidine kinase/CheY-like chemotaxis protein
MLTPDGGRVVLMDFGLAKGKSLALTNPSGGEFLGTMRYAAPEQLLGKQARPQLGPVSDVRALGCILWELLTRQRLFEEASNQAELAGKVLNEDVPQLRTIDASFDRDLEAIVARATERVPRHRIQTAVELAQYLQLYLDGRPLPIRAPGLGELVWRRVRKNKLLISAIIIASVVLVATVPTAATLAVLLTVGIALLLVVQSRSQAITSRNEALELAERERRARDEALEARAEAMRARDQAVEANRTKSQFLAGISWELCSPLTAVIGYSEILLEEAREAGHTDFLPDLEQIHSHSKHLLKLINDLLDMSKIETGKMQLYLETFDLARLIEDLANTVEPLVLKQGNTLRIEAPGNLGTLHADITRVRQCLLNLLTNASSRANDSTITLAVSREQREEQDWVKFRVSDTGTVIAPEQVRMLFEGFAPVDALNDSGSNDASHRLNAAGSCGAGARRGAGGSNDASHRLNAAVTLRLSHLLGGTIIVETEQGKGTALTLLVPVVIKAHAEINRAEAEALGPGPSPHRPKVLIVDDDASVRDMLSRWLDKEGFEGVPVASALDVLAVARQVRPSAITLDVMMPSMDGWAVLSALKADPDLSNIPVIIISIIDDKNLACALGAADLITKPMERSRILQVLRGRCGATSDTVLLPEAVGAERQTPECLPKNEG